MTRYKLYGRPNSGSLAVQVALEEIGAPYTQVWVSTDPADVETHTQVNPTGRVPALELPDGTVIFESAAILIHLALLHPSAGLAPAPATTAHARFLQWMVFLSANVYQSVLRMYYPERYSARGEADADAIRVQATTNFIAQLELVCRSLGPFVLGAEYSIADVYLYMLAAWYPEGKVALYLRLPALGAHAELLTRRASLAKAELDHPPH